jgi:hypothetical protein
MCPQITLTGKSDRYCGESGNGECRTCGESTPGGADIPRWRERHGHLITQARHVLVPSRDTGRRYLRMWGSANVRLAPHTDMATTATVPAPQPQALQEGAPLRVAVIGALSRIKGADLLEDVAILASEARLPIEFHLIGFGYRQLQKQPKAALTVYGPYEENELPGLLSWVKPDVVWFPALWPETYSYTLSACLQAGLPIVAPNLGSFPERLSGRKWSWIRPWDTPAEDWPTFFAQLREAHFLTGESPKPHWEVAPVAQDVLMGGWSYDRDYLRDVTVRPLPAEAPDGAFLLAHRAGGGVGLDRHRRRLKQLALTAIVRLRATPPLRGVARAIPLRWQTRVKSWLRA